MEPDERKDRLSRERSGLLLVPIVEIVEERISPIQRIEDLYVWPQLGAPARYARIHGPGDLQIHAQEIVLGREPQRCSAP